MPWLVGRGDHALLEFIGDTDNEGEIVVVAAVGSYDLFVDGT